MKLTNIAQSVIKEVDDREKKVKQHLAGAKKLQKDIDSAFNKWNERSQFKLGGIGNLSKSDLDILSDICDVVINSDGTETPRGSYHNTEIEKVAKKYGVFLTSGDLWS